MIGSTHFSAQAALCLSVLLWVGCTFFAHVLLFLPIFAVDNAVRIRKALNFCLVLLWHWHQKQLFYFKLVLSVCFFFPWVSFSFFSVPYSYFCLQTQPMLIAQMKLITQQGIFSVHGNHQVTFLLLSCVFAQVLTGLTFLQQQCFQYLDAGHQPKSTSERFCQLQFPWLHCYFYFLCNR